MYVFSLVDKITDKMKVVARVDGGSDDGMYLILKEVDKKEVKKPEFLKNLSYLDYKDDLKAYKPSERQRVLSMLEEAFYKGYGEDDMIDGKMKPIYKRVLENENKDDEVVLEDGKFTICFQKNTFSLLYITGACGAGKSFLALKVAQNYDKIYKGKNNIYLLSKLKEDKTLDSFKKIKRINPESFLEDPPTAAELSDSLLIADDYESYQTTNPKLYMLIIGLLNDIAMTGRHTNTNLICIQHLVTNGKYSRLIIAESTHIVVYPQSATNHNLRYLLMEHCGLDNKKIKEIKSCKSRFVVLYKHHPNWLITETEAKLL